MTSTFGAAPFSIAVDLPSYRKSLVERLLHGLKTQAPDLVWMLADAAHADVVLRAADANDISPHLVADVRRPGGCVDAVRIDSPWRPGALLDAMRRIAPMLRPEPALRGAPEALAWQWLARWSGLAASGAQAIEWRIGHRTIAFADPRASTWTPVDAGDADPDHLLAEMVHDGYTLAATGAPPPPGARPLPLKPLLWRFGMRAGMRGPLPSLASRGALKLKGWPYLAAGGPRSFVDLIAYLRAGLPDAASLRALALAPVALVDGFLNACDVCDFFHDGVVATQPAPDASLPSGAARLGAVVAQSRERQTISSIRRVLGVEHS
ncbi:MAG TPA: hypothetical protein VJ724_03440 [Tahibacter sp.]|nr:hypothetical protein [Tahibacter sp.]